MYDKIIVSLALDHGHGFRAIEVAKKLVNEGGKIFAVHAIEPVQSSVSLYVPPEYVINVKKTAEEGIAERIGDAKGIETVVLTGHSGRVIAEYAETIKADCIIVGSHKPELQDYLLGSTAARIVRHAPCSVHVLR